MNDHHEDCTPQVPEETSQALARDLLEMHDQQAISLDTWVAGREFVEAFFGPIEENGA